MFVVLSGLPGSGKSTLGALLAAALELPLLDKDAFLERLFDAEPGASRHHLSRQADAALRAAALPLKAAVLISWWRHPLSSAPSGTPVDWLTGLRGELMEIHCACSPAVAFARFRSRARHLRHEDRARADDALLAQLEAQAEFGPLGLAPVVRVDAEAPFDVPAILGDIEAALGDARSSRRSQ